MSSQEEVAYSPEQTKKVISIVWYGQLVSGVIMIAIFYFVIPEMEIEKTLSEHNLYFLMGGILSGLGLLFYRRYFGELLRSNRSLPDEEFWSLVRVKMMPGIALAQLPFFMAGVPGYMLAGSQQTFLILGAYSLALLFMAKPPKSKP